MVHVPYIALVVAYSLIFVPRFIVWREMGKLEGGYDNREPRTQQLLLVGLGKRALAAHANAFEAFAPFAAGVLAALQRGARVELVAWLAIAFVVARTVYVVAYVADRPSIRSGFWSLGVAATTALLLVAVIG